VTKRGTIYIIQCVCTEYWTVTKLSSSTK